MGSSLRADAQANHDRLLEAAARAFAREGADASLKAIASEAGVGIGTLYRRFPAREDLVEATYRAETARLAAAADALLAARPPVEALTAWMEDFVEYMRTKRGMAEALPAILATREGLRLRSRELLGEAVATLLRHGAAAGVLRSDVTARDVLMALGGVTMISGYEDDPALASRLVGLLVDGLVTVRGAGGEAGGA
ncbi:TetR/AcrR family transcriptional regulator [Streptomyces sp. P6-2-1]|uniref:TetR/AcrR family transcriptional regulator n=1 Tax=unclassified Streptomyces TaxID=2593676 RepID=UPI003D369A6F